MASTPEPVIWIVMRLIVSVSPGLSARMRMSVLPFSRLAGWASLTVNVAVFQVSVLVLVIRPAVV